jgi:hypothetical protein
MSASKIRKLSSDIGACQTKRLSLPTSHSCAKPKPDRKRRQFINNMLSPSSRRRHFEEAYSYTNPFNGYQVQELAALPAELPGCAGYRELPADSNYRNITDDGNNRPYFEHDPTPFPSQNDNVPSRSPYSVLPRDENERIHMQQQQGCFSPSIPEYAGVSPIEANSLSFAGSGAPQQTHIPETTYAGFNASERLNPSLPSPSFSPDNPTLDFRVGQVLPRMTDADARLHMAPDSAFILAANGYQPYRGSQNSRNNGHHDQLVSPTSTHQTSYNTYNSYQPSQSPHSMTSPSPSRYVHAENQAPHAFYENVPFSPDHVGQSFFPHPFAFPPQPPINTSVGAAESSSQFNQWEPDPVFSPLTRGSGMHAIMTKYKEPDEEPPPMYSPIPPHCERGIIMQPSSDPEPHGQPPVASRSCGYADCNSAFTGKYAGGNRGKLFRCLADGCDKVFKRDDARLKHEREKHGRPGSKPQRKGDKRGV